ARRRSGPAVPHAAQSQRQSVPLRRPPSRVRPLISLALRRAGLFPPLTELVQRYCGLARQRPVPGQSLARPFRQSPARAPRGLPAVLRGPPAVLRAPPAV